MTVSWIQQDNEFSPIPKGLEKPILPPGIYVCHPKHTALIRTADQFTLPDDLLFFRQDIIDRVSNAFDHVSGNLGVSLTGLKGTGKTVTSQILCNDFIAKYQAPVILVSNPAFNVKFIFGAVKQPYVIFFDEWEKVMAANEDAEAELLPLLDGASDRAIKRLVLFTSNDTSKIRDAFFDRPSRIRYTYNFDRLTRNELENMLPQLLPVNRHEDIDDTIETLETLDTLSFDVIKSITKDMALFEEQAENTIKHMNLSVTNQGLYEIWQINESGEKIKLITKVEVESEPGIETAFKGKSVNQVLHRYNSNTVHLLRPGPLPRTYFAKYRTVPTWCKLFESRWWCEEPKDFVKPAWATAKKMTAKMENEMDTFFSADTSTIYGTDTPGIILVRIERSQQKMKWSVQV